MIKKLMLVAMTAATLAIGTGVMTSSAEARVVVCNHRHHRCHVVHRWHPVWHPHHWRHHHMR
jgi:hypothetical protein